MEVPHRKFSVPTIPTTPELSQHRLPHFSVIHCQPLQWWQRGPLCKRSWAWKAVAKEVHPCFQGAGAGVSSEGRPGRLAGQQQDRQPHSTGTHPGPGYRRVLVPMWPLSGFALSSGARGQAGPCLCLRLDRAALAESQSSSPPPGKPKVLCSSSTGDTHTASLTLTWTGENTRARCQEREQALCTQPVGALPAPEQKTRASGQRRGAAGKPQRPEAADGGSRDK